MFTLKLWNKDYQEPQNFWFHFAAKLDSGKDLPLPAWYIRKKKKISHFFFQKGFRIQNFG